MESKRGTKPLHTANYAQSQLKRLTELLCKNAPLHQTFPLAIIVSSLIEKLTYQQIEIDFRNNICQRSKAILESENLTPAHRETLENIIEIANTCENKNLIGFHFLLEHIENLANR